MEEGKEGGLCPGNVPREKHPPPRERSFTLKEQQPVGQGLELCVCGVCVVSMNTFTLELEEPGKLKSTSATEARKNGNFGRSRCNY